MNTEIAKTLKNLDPNLQPNDPAYNAAAFLLASLRVGPSQKKVRDLIGCTWAQVSQFAYRAKKNKIWHGRKVQGNWMDKKNGAASFWMDVCVIVGWMERA